VYESWHSSSGKQICGNKPGACVGEGVGPGVGAGVGSEVGAGVGAEVGADVGPEVGAGVGPEVGAGVGPEVGADVGPGGPPALLGGADQTTQKEADAIVQVKCISGVMLIPTPVVPLHK